MKTTSTTCLLLILIIGIANGQNSTDSILSNQVEATTNVGAQVRRLRKEVEKFNSFDQERFRNAIDSISQLHNGEMEKLEKAISGIESNVSGLNSKDKTKDKSIWEKSTPQIIGAFMGAGSALLVFYLGMWRTRRKESKKEKKEHKEKIHYLSSLLNSTIDLSRKQFTGLKAFCQKIDDDPINIPLIPIHPIQDIERLSKTFDNEQYYHAFLDEFGDETEVVKLYRGLANNIDFLLKQFEQMYDMQHKKQLFDVERKRKYGGLLEVIKDEVLRLGEHYQSTNKPFSDFVLDTFKNHYDNLTDEKRTELKYFEESLVVPLKKGFLNEHKNLPQANYFVQQLKRLSSIYDEIPMQNKAHANDYRELFENVEKAINKLEEKGKGVLDKLNTKDSKPESSKTTETPSASKTDNNNPDNQLSPK